jgi:hypothetical protein
MSGKAARRARQRRNKKEASQWQMDRDDSDFDDYLPEPMEIQPINNQANKAEGFSRQQEGSASAGDCLSWNALLESNFPAGANKEGHVADDESKKGLYSKRLQERALPLRNNETKTKGYPCQYTEYLRYEVKKYEVAPVLTYGQVTQIMKNTLQQITFRQTEEGPCADEVTDMDRRLKPNKNLPVERKRPENHKNERWHREATNLADSLTDSEVIDILAEIKQYGFACIDTEGKNPPLMIQIGSPTGRVLLVRTKDLRGEQIQEMLEDPQIIKFQSDIQADAEQFEQIGINIQSCVNTQNLCKQWDPECDQIKVGTEATAKRWKVQYSPYKFEGLSIGQKRWAYEEDGFRPLDLIHAVQDVRVHTYALYGCAQKSAEKMFGIIPGDEKCQINIYPLIHQILASWLDLQPNIQNVHKDCWEWPVTAAPWMPAFNHTEVSHKPRALKDIQHYFDTANTIILVKDYDLPLKLRVPKGEEVYKDIQRLAKATEKMWRDHPLPKNLGPETRLPFCTTCGGHNAEHPEGPCKLGLWCLYPLCKTRKFHSSTVCHTMIYRCQICRRRGHHEEHHRYYDPLTLDYTFLQWAPLHMMTSLIFAEVSDNERIRKQALPNHWRLSLYGRNRYQSQQLVSAYGITYEWPRVEPLLASKKKRLRNKTNKTKDQNHAKKPRIREPEPQPEKVSAMEVGEPEREDPVVPAEVASRQLDTPQHERPTPSNKIPAVKATVTRPTNEDLLREQQKRANLFGVSNRRVAAREAMLRRPEALPKAQLPKTTETRHSTQPLTPGETVRQFKIPKKPKAETEAERNERHRRIRALEASLRALKRTPSPPKRPAERYHQSHEKNRHVRDHRNQPKKLYLRGQPKQSDLRGQPQEFDLRGQPQEFDLRGQPKELDLRGQPKQFDLRGQPKQSELRGQPTEFDLRGQPRHHEWGDRRDRHREGGGNRNHEKYRHSDEVKSPRGYKRQ